MQSTKWISLFPLITLVPPLVAAPVDDSGLSFPFREVAIIPDSTPGLPPRVSVVTEDSHGRLFANDQRGPLYHIDPGTGIVTEYLDIRDYPELDLLSTFEAGFQAFAFHPDFHRIDAEGFGRFYTIHSSNNTSETPDFDPGGNTSCHTLLVEWKTGSPETVPFAPESQDSPYRILMRFKQPFGNHNAGLIAFNPLALPGSADFGNLYIALGDGGSGGDPQENAEDPGNPFGAILRINPTGSDAPNEAYGIVTDNAFAGDEDASTLAEIYAYGLRNPQRFGWDIASGQLYIADIGQNKWEEINAALPGVANGGHFGWDIREGFESFEGPDSASLIDPFAVYSHFDGFENQSPSISNRAVTLGEVVRGARIPDLEGYLLVADFPTGILMRIAALPAPSGQLQVIQLERANGQSVNLLQLVNEVRAARDLGSSSRADARFSVNTPGRVFISTKHDGVLRQLLPDSAPRVSLVRNEEGLRLDFNGMPESSRDLQSWDYVLPFPEAPLEISLDEAAQFFRAR